MGANRSELERLFATDGIDIRRGKIFDMPPGPMPASVPFDRLEGMMLGLAVGDALGNPTESMTAEERSANQPEIRDYIKNKIGTYKGIPSDDSQLAFWTLEQLIADNGLVPDHLAARFCKDRIYGIGKNMREFIENYKDMKMPWQKAGPKSAGNGALMRIAPMVFPHLKTGTTDLWVDTALSAMITHNDSASIAACLAFTDMLWQLLQMDAPPAPDWWVDTYVKVARDLEQDDTYRPRGGKYRRYQGTLWQFVEERVPEAYRQKLSVRDASDSWYSGAYLLETVPAALYILMRYGNDLEEAIIRSVNDTKDNDTIAAIVGAALGALYGKQGIPQRWLANLSGRTKAGDDGAMFRLLDAARSTFWH